MRLPRLRSAMGRMMAAVAVIAAAFVDAGFIALVLISIGPVVATWSLVATPTDDPPHRRAIPDFVTPTAASRARKRCYRLLTGPMSGRPPAIVAEVLRSLAVPDE